MNLLLLLSALFSALTGVGAAARAPQVAVSVTRAAETVVAAQAKPARVAGSTSVAVPRLAQSATLVIAPAWRLAPAAPLYLSRRRE